MSFIHERFIYGSFSLAFIVQSFSLPHLHHLRFLLPISLFLSRFFLTAADIYYFLGGAKVGYKEIPLQVQDSPIFHISPRTEPESWSEYQKKYGYERKKPALPR